jgi:hypothetical protein
MWWVAAVGVPIGIKPNEEFEGMIARAACRLIPQWVMLREQGFGPGQPQSFVYYLI